MLIRVIFLTGAQEDGGYIEGCDANNATDMDELVNEDTEVLVASVRVQLPLSVLVLRRGLALAAMLVLLAAGLSVKFFLKRWRYNSWRTGTGEMLECLKADRESSQCMS